MTFEEKNIKKVLEIKRLRLHNLYSQAPFCMGILMGSNYVYEMASAYYLQLLGKEDIIGKTVKEVSPELEAQGIYSFLNTVYKTGETVSVNEMLVQLDLHRNRKKVDVYLNFIFQAHRNSSGVVVGIFFFVNDVTKQVVSRKKTEESEKKYRYLFKNNQLPMCIIDLNTFKFLDVNEMSIYQYGYSRKEFLSMTAQDLMSDGDMVHYAQSSESLKIKKTNYNKEIWNHKKKNGTVIPVQSIAQNIVFEGVLARFIIMEDITKLKKTELELVKTNAELDRFVYSVSHDLRSPLRAILGLISFIEEESMETNTLKHIKMVRNSVNRLDEYIENILNYSRNNRTVLEVKRVSLQKTVAAIVETFHSIKEAKGIHFEIEIKELHPFYSDRLRFNTIMENIISNAIKYHKDAELGNFIKISGQSDHEKLQISISDNGIGIAPAFHNKIFDMFFRLSGEKEGSGIGLYIVKDMVNILKGSIQVQSEKGIGTTFIVTLKNFKDDRHITT